MLLRTSDLPAGRWRQLDERTWRTGEADSSEDWARRAREDGSMTAWRSFENDERTEWLWAQVSPMASEDDARTALADVPSRMLRNLRAEVTLTASRDVTAPDVGTAGPVWAYEQDTLGVEGEALTYYLAFTVSHVVGAMCASGRTMVAGWDGVANVGHSFVSRIQTAIADAE